MFHFPFHTSPLLVILALRSLEYSMHVTHFPAKHLPPVFLRQNLNELRTQSSSPFFFHLFTCFKIIKSIFRLFKNIAKQLNDLNYVLLQSMYQIIKYNMENVFPPTKYQKEFNKNPQISLPFLK